MLFTFPSQYWFAIGLPSIFSLAGWSPRIQTGFLVSRLTQDTGRSVVGFGYGAVTRCGASFQALLLSDNSSWPGPTTPETPKRPRFGLFPFRSPLLRKSRFLSFPAGTKMFQFPAFAHLAMYAAFSRTGCPIRTPADQVSFADPRGFSQLRASFVADGSQGILRMLLSNFLYVLPW